MPSSLALSLLVVILGALLILGCWYFKKRSGYRIIRVRSSHFTVIKHSLRVMGFCGTETCQVCIPNAPPSYEKISSGPLPPPYSP
uniref:Melan-A n=1 Tax=Acanthochromis polyacanthus TaxID=80966 RepID=A0A3Q1ET82_9TELE